MAISVQGHSAEEETGTPRRRSAARKAGMIAIGVTLAALAIAAIVSGAHAGRGRDGADSATRADYLYRFAPFVEWPKQAFARHDAPLAICILGEDPFGPALDEAVRGRFVKGHPVIVQRIVALAPETACHILYISRAGDRDVAAALHDTRGRPILTVTDFSPGAPGGVIQFLRQNGRVRFTIDVRAAQVSQLQISAKLLQLALPDEP